MNGKIKKVGKIVALAALPAGILGTSIWGHFHNKYLREQTLENFKNSETFAIYLKDSEKQAETLKQEYENMQLQYDNGEITDTSQVAAKRNEYDEYRAYAESNQYAIDCILKNKESVYYANYHEADGMVFLAPALGTIFSAAVTIVEIGIVLDHKKQKENNSEVSQFTGYMG